MSHEFKIKIIAIYFFVFLNNFSGCFIVFVPDNIRNFSFQTGRACYQAFIMFLEEVFINSWFIIESLGPTPGNKFDKVMVSFQILCEQYQVKSAAIGLI